VYWGSGTVAPRILDLGSRWRWVVSFTPRLLYPQGKRPWYPLDRRLGGAQSRSGHGDEKFSAFAGTRIPDHPVRSPALYHWAIPAPVYVTLPNMNLSEYKGMCSRPWKWTHLEYMSSRVPPSFPAAVVLSLTNNTAAVSVCLSCNSVPASHRIYHQHLSGNIILQRAWRCPSSLTTNWYRLCRCILETWRSLSRHKSWSYLFQILCDREKGGTLRISKIFYCLNMSLSEEGFLRFVSWT
jgi:hypothetical protein